MGLRQQPRSFSPHPRDVETTNADTLQSAFNLRSPLKPISPSLRRANSTFQYLTAKASSALSHDIMENGSSSEGKDPSAFLSEIIGAPVIVKLNSGVVYKGELQSVDGYMNIALEKTEEFVNGKLRRNYGDAFVRGNNVLYISAN
ncbi:unnamed protein product [Penicillium manginii]